MEGIVTELLRFAFTGVNIIPTAFLLLMQLYWLVAIIGLFDFDFIDLDIDLESGDVSGPLSGIAVFINIGEVPVALAFSFMVLNFWTLSMLMYFLPFEQGGTIAGILLLPILIISVYLTRYEILPLKGFFYEKKNNDDIEHKVLTQRCTMMCDLEPGRLGQARVKRQGASIVINVKTLFEKESFKKGEVAFVFRKDDEEDVYYIAKSLMKEEFKLETMLEDKKEN